MRITDATFALVDTETSGVEPGDDLLEVAVHLYTFENFTITPGARFSSLVKPISPIPPEASGVHHLTIDDFENAPYRDQVEHDLDLMLTEGFVPVAHNAAFDMRVLDLQMPAICTERMAHHLTPEAPNFKLQTLRYYYGFPHLDMQGMIPHRADADLIVLAPVFFHLIARYRAWAEELCAGDEARLEKAMQVETLIDWLNRPYPMLVWPVGPADAKGKPFAEIDTGLLTWGLRQDFNADFKWNIARELKRRGKA